MKWLLTLTLCLLPVSPAWAQKADKGLLPELKLEKNNEDVNQKKAVQSEVLISKSEIKAIAALNAVLKKKKGSPQEPDLWFRLAELYMRRAKSGRFFDLTRGHHDSPVKFAPPEVREETAIANLKQAIAIYTKIERDFPSFKEMDIAMFNNAFASQQVGQKKSAEQVYARMVQKYPRSSLVPDAYLALGEMKYDAGLFAVALEDFRAIEKYPASRVYSYGLYKQAWTHYNLKQNEDGIKKLLEVVKFFDPENSKKVRVSHNLRSEALRDLALFFGESHSADEAYSFFARICTPDELGDSMINLGKLYDSHGRQKEMNVFLGDYIKKNPNASLRVKAEMLLIQGNETLKSRPDVIKHMESAAEVCRPGSDWRKENPTTSEADCDYDLAKVNLDIAKKWWELWLKNKSNKSMADLTERAFKIHLDREDPLKPDTKSHYAYAELLYQQDKFREASEQYEFAGLKSTDTQIAHDSLYSSIVSLEKASEKSEKPGDNAKLVSLSQIYLKKYPQGAQASQVHYKIGFIAYEEKNYGEAEKWLKPLALDSKQDGALRTRSQDLMLDILNARQDLGGLRDFSKTVMNQTDNADRKKNMQKIMQEADFNSIQKDMEKAQVTESIQKLLAFHQENKGSTQLAKKSLKQAMSLAFSNGRSLQGADLAIQYAKTYPDDTETTAALKEAAKHYNEQGFLMRAAQTFELLAPRLKGTEQTQIFEAASEIYVLENRKTDAREFLHKLLLTADKKEQGKLYSRLLQTYKGEENSAEYTKLENKILALNVEPTASEIQLGRVQKLFDNKKYTEVFNAAKGLVGSDAPAPIRAQARLLQARVLEWELSSQSTKTTLERLPLVLSIKTEKLEKAQAGFLAAASYSKDPNVQLATLEGLARIYKNYVETVGTPIIKTEMKPDETKALHDELRKLVTPIEQKQKDIENKLVQLAKSEKTATSKELDFANLPITETVKPVLPDIPFEQMAPYLPKLTQVEGLFASRDVVTGKTSCQTDAKDLQTDLAGLMNLANRCVALKKFTQIEKIAARIAELEPSSGAAPYYLSLAAMGLGLRDKSLYLIDLALKKNDRSFFWYQKALALGATGDRAGANQWMIKAYDERLDAWETRLFHGVVAFSQGDCFSVTDSFKALPTGQLDRFALMAAYSECTAQKGEVDAALAMIQKAALTQKSLALFLQWGHLAEIYKSDSKAAAGAYERARSLTSDEAQKDWLKRKIDWLGNPTPVTQASNSTMEKRQ